MKRFIVFLIFLSVLAFSALFGYKYLQKTKATTTTTSQESNKEPEYVSNQDMYPIQYDIPVDKEWVFSFDNSLDANTINADTVSVVDENNSKVNVSVSLTNNNHSISIKAPSDGYTKGAYYELHMSDKISYSDGNSVSKPYKMGFIITRDKVKEIVFNKNIIKINNQDDILSHKNNIVTISKKAVSKQLKTDDILTIPTNDENMPEQAIKITNVKEKDGKYIIEYKEPKFIELFEKLNLYENISFTSKDAKFIPAKGVEMKPIASSERQTQIAASGSNSKSASKNGEFQFEKTNDSKAEVELSGNGVELSLNRLSLKIEGQSVEFSAKLKLMKPELLQDIDIGFMELNRFNSVVTTSAAQETIIELNTDEQKLKELIKKKGIKPSDRDGWLVEGDVPLGTVVVPIVPGLAALLELKGVPALNADGKIEFFVNSSLSTEAGVYYSKGKEFKPVLNIDPEINAGFRTKATVEAKGALGLESGLSGLGVASAQIDTQVGGYSYQEANVTGNTSTDDNVCLKGDYGAIGEMYLDLGTFWDDDWYEFKTGQLKIQIDNFNKCEETTDISVFPEIITMKAGETLKLDLKEVVSDKLSGTKKKKSFLNEETLKDFDLMTSNSDAVDVSILPDKEKSKKPSAIKVEVGNGEQGKNIKVKFEKVDPQEYHAFLKVPKEVYEDKATITVKYQDFKKEIPVIIQGTQTKVSDSEAKEIVDSLTDKIVGVFQDLGEKYTWHTNNPADFSVMRPELLKYATPEFADNVLKKRAKDYYCGCDNPVFPNGSLDARFNVTNNKGSSFNAASVEFINDIGNGGNHVYYTVKRVDGEWKLDGWERESWTKRPLNVTWKEIQAYEKSLDTNVELLKETTYNGKKIYIVGDQTTTPIRIQGVYAHNTEILYEVPNELLPKEYQKTTSGDLNGVWKRNIGDLVISGASKSTFDFSINVVNPNRGHVGDISGTATIQNDTAHFTDKQYACSLTFSLQGDSIQVEESSECTNWHGMAVDFNGVYRKEE